MSFDAILAASHAAINMVVELEPYGLEARLGRSAETAYYFGCQ
jgi:hypothetical protein